MKPAFCSALTTQSVLLLMCVPLLLNGQTPYVSRLAQSPSVSQSPSAKRKTAMSIGIFENQQDVGTLLHPGSGAFDAGRDAYTVTGSGENMWSTQDAFHFVWKKAAGDLSLTADIAFPLPGKEPHRKACLMIRQSLDADSAYADVALHGDGLTSLQFREARGSATHEVQANLTGPPRLRLEKRGKYVRMYLSSGKEEKLHFSGAAVQMDFKEPFYIGLGVCAHNKDVTEQAVFSKVELDTDLPAPDGAAHVVQRPGDADDCLHGSPRRACHAHPPRSAQLAAGRENADLQQRRPSVSSARQGRNAGSD